MRIIEIQNVSFAYPGREAVLENFSLSVEKGECVLLCGESGCGKTTVIRLIDGLIPHFVPDCQPEGHVTVGGMDTAKSELYQLAHVVGSVFQNPKSQFFNLDTDSELAFGLENRGEPPENIRKRLDAATQALHIERLLHRNIFSLSGGEKQALATASVYVTGPDVYVLDEPSANLDEASIEILRRNLFQLKAEGKTIVIAEHRLYFLTELIDRAVYMKDGQICRIFSKKELLAMTEQKRTQLGLRALQPAALQLPAANITSDGGLTCTGLCCGYKKNPDVVKHLSFSLQRGTVAALTGHNGVGKSTLTRCLCGLLPEQAGSISLDGQRLKAKVRQHTCYLVMQDVNHQLFSDSVWDECEQSGAAAENIEAVLTDLGLWEWRDRHPMALSGGQKQRLAIASAVLSRRPVLIFDEPTSGLDYRSMCRVSALLRRLAEDGRIVIVVSHDGEFMRLTCDCEIHLTKGGSSYERI